MDESLIRTVAFTIAGYPLNVTRTLAQLGYEPFKPDQYGNLPNMFSYLSYVREQRGYTMLYAGISCYLPAVVLKQVTYNLLVSATNHKKDTNHSDASEIIAVCLRESALKIHATIITYPLLTLSIGYITSAFFGAKETVDYSVQALYKGIVPKLITEVVLIWVGIISRRLTAYLIEDDLSQTIVSRAPPFIVQTLLYPFNVVSTVMADNGKSGLNPRFENWKQCYHYLSMNNQLKRGSSIFYRCDYKLAARQPFIKRYTY